MDFINNNVNIFFFVTTIFVVILIIIFIIVLIASIKLYRFMNNIISQGEVFLEEAKTNNFVKKAAPIVLPIILPIVSFFYKIKKNKKSHK